jgi:DNA polymerase (family 10)
VPRSNDQVEQVLLEYADLLSITSADPFKPRAYEKAARAIAGEADDLRSMNRSAILRIPGVGRSIAAKIGELLDTGTFAELEELRTQVPAGVVAMTKLSGFGPKRALHVYRELGLSSVEELVDAAEAGRLSKLKGFSHGVEAGIIRAAERSLTSAGRMRIDQASDIAEQLLGELLALPETGKGIIAGSLRRMRETVGDVDLLVTSRDATAVMDAFGALPAIRSVLARGTTKASVLVEQDLQVDLRVVAPQAWGAALIYFTGSKAHNVRLREMAVRADLRLNEYGLFEAETERLVVSSTERSVYEHLGLRFIPPTLREDTGEIEAAAEDALPSLITAKSIKGELHLHTDLTDGRHDLQRMLDAAAERGFTYVAVTDHAPNLAMQRMTLDKMLDQRRALRSLQDRYPGMRLLHGVELNIGRDGTVDWDADVLSGFDMTVASVHANFKLSREEQTRRLVRAIENPFVDLLGHPSTRKIGARDPIDADWAVVYEVAARTGTALEINCRPDRLDLRDEEVSRARRAGARFAIDTDAHADNDLDLLRYGIGVAQRGWVSAQDVVNAWPLGKLERFLARRRPSTGP